MKTSFLITAVLIARRLLSHLTALPSVSAFENRRKHTMWPVLLFPVVKPPTNLYPTRRYRSIRSWAPEPVLTLTRWVRSRCLMTMVQEWMRSVPSRKEQFSPYHHYGQEALPSKSFPAPFKYMHQKVLTNPLSTSSDIRTIPPSSPSHRPPWSPQHSSGQPTPMEC